MFCICSANVWDLFDVSITKNIIACSKNWFLNKKIKISKKNFIFIKKKNDLNIEKLTKLVDNGSDVYPGAKSVQKNTITITINANNKRDIIVANIRTSRSLC